MQNIFSNYYFFSLVEFLFLHYLKHMKLRNEHPLADGHKSTLFQASSITIKKQTIINR